MEPTVFIYGLCDPETKSVRYIGKARQPHERFVNHIGEAKRGSHLPVHCWIRSLVERGLTPELRVLEECPESVWQSLEREWIANIRLYKGRELLNVADGGEGNTFSTSEERSVASKKWWEANPDARQHLSFVMKQKWESDREKNVARLRATAHVANRGRRHTPEALAKMSAAAKGRKIGPMSEEGRQLRRDNARRGPRDRVLCEVCGKDCGVGAGLTSHMKVHADD